MLRADWIHSRCPGEPFLEKRSVALGLSVWLKAVAELPALHVQRQALYGETVWTQNFKLGGFAYLMAYGVVLLAGQLNR